MSHLDEGTVQAFLDGELPARQRAEAAEHMMGCPACRALHGELRDASVLFSEAVGELDLDAPPTPTALPPARPARAGRMARFGTGSLAKAAGILLFLAAAASAAVPGSPVRTWIESAVRPEARGPEPSATPPAREPVAEGVAQPASAPAAPAGLSIRPSDGRLDVDLDDLEGMAIRLRKGAGESVTVSTTGAERDPSFRMAAGRIGVHDGVGGELLVELPTTWRDGRIVADGRVLAEMVAGELRVQVPADTVDGAVVWR